MLLTTKLRWVRHSAILAATLIAVALSGCTAVPSVPKSAAQAAPPEDSLPTASAEHNKTDVTFLQMMIEHHEQARELTQLAAQRAVREEVRLLAAAIDSTQTEEVSIMQSWLRGWNEPTTAPQAAGTHGGMNHANHGGSPPTGADQIAALRQATGADFELKFLTLLTGHQHTAVEMTQQIATDGRNPQTQELARRVKESRTDQIAQMLKLMNG